MSLTVLTAADYAYSDTVDLLYQEVKETIANWMDHLDLSEVVDEKRPGIPGTIKELNARVQHMLRMGAPAKDAAHQIEIKVREAYKLPPA